MSTHSTRQHAGARSGFSLLEILIILAVMAIIALLVLPSAGKHDQTHVRLAVQLLVADLEHAQVTAIGRGADPCVFVFDVAEGGYHLALAADPQTPLTHPTTHNPFRTRFGEGRAAGLGSVTFTTLEVDEDDQLAFNAMGGLERADDAVITLASNDVEITILIDPTTGEPRIAP